MIKDNEALHNALTKMFEQGDNNTILHIIDDYNIDYKTVNETIEYFVKEINRIEKIKKIRIYVQTDKYDLSTSNNQLMSIDNAFKKKLSCALAIFMKTKKIYSSFKWYSADRAYDKICKFMSGFKGKTCEFVVYENLNTRPPFHGRYWLSANNGLIIDGSLNTVDERLVLAQEMDDVNFSIVKERLNSVLNSGDDVRFDKNKLDDLKKTYEYIRVNFSNY